MDHTERRERERESDRTLATFVHEANAPRLEGADIMAAVMFVGMTFVTRSHLYKTLIVGFAAPPRPAYVQNQFPYG